MKRRRRTLDGGGSRTRTRFSADGETDEVYAQMTLQPAIKHDQEALLVSDVGLCKTLTASDTSTHG
ncbi:Auxin response factor 19 [Orobanche minor]